MFRMRHTVAMAAFGLGMLSASAASAVEVELKYDGFVENGMVVCQQGFGENDQAGVTFTHDTAYTIQRVQFVFCGADTTETVTLRVYRDTGGSVPGAILFQGDYEVTGSADSVTEISLAAEGIALAAGESFRVALLIQHDGPPGLANDSDGMTNPGTSWLYDDVSGSWAQASSFGVNGDWIMRAYIDAEEPMGTGGAGSMAMSSTSTTMMTGSGGAGGAGGSASEDGGETESDCGCTVVGSPTRNAGAWMLLAGLCGLARRRRRC